MEDIIDYLRQQRMEQPPLPTPLSHSVRPKQRRTTYESIKLRLHLGLPGSIALMTAVGCMAPLYWDNAGYMTCAAHHPSACAHCLTDEPGLSTCQSFAWSG